MAYASLRKRPLRHDISPAVAAGSPNAARVARQRAKILGSLDPLARMVMELRQSVRDVEPAVLVPCDVASPKGREGRAHLWLRAVLHHMAMRAGFTDPAVLDETGRDVPDVVLHHPGLGVLFIGDAKDAFQKTQRARGSYGQILSYFSSARLALRGRGYRCALVAIATNEIHAGLEWFSTLSRMASERRLVIIPNTAGVTVGAAGTCVATTLVRLPKSHPPHTCIVERWAARCRDPKG